MLEGGSGREAGAHLQLNLGTVAPSPDPVTGGGGGGGMAAHPAPSCFPCQDLMQYCAQDVWATYEVFQQQLPLFLER